MDDTDPKSENPSTSESEPRYRRFSTPSEQAEFLQSLREDLLAGAAQLAEGNQVLDLETRQPIKVPFQLPQQATGLDEPVYREPLAPPLGFYTYVLNSKTVLNNLYEMQWTYFVEWPEEGVIKIHVVSYRCYQRLTPDEEFKKVDHIPHRIPMSNVILRALIDHAAQELCLRATVLGRMEAVPENFQLRAEEAVRKGYDLKLLREMSQREVGTTTPT